MSPCVVVVLAEHASAARRAAAPGGGSYRVRFASGGPTALVLHFLKLRIDHIFLGLRAGGGPGSPRTGLTARRAATSTALTGRLVGGMGPLHDAGRRLCQSFGLLLDRLFVVRLEDRAQIAECGLSLGALVAGDLFTEILERLLDLMHQTIGMVAGLDQFAKLAIFGGIRLGILDHALDLFVIQAARGANHDALFLAGGLVLGRHVQNAIGVDIEGHLDLRHATSCLLYTSPSPRDRQKSRM